MCQGNRLQDVISAWLSAEAWNNDVNIQAYCQRIRYYIKTKHHKMWSIAASIWKWMYDIESETRLNLYQEMSTRELDYLVMLPRYQAISSYHKMCDLLRKDIIVFISYDMILWYDMILGISQKCYRVEMIHNMINNHTITFEHDIYTENEMIPSCYNAIQREKIYENNLQIHVLHNLAARLKSIYQNDQHTRLQYILIDIISW